MFSGEKSLEDKFQESKFSICSIHFYIHKIQDRVRRKIAAQYIFVESYCFDTFPSFHSANDLSGPVSLEDVKENF